MSDWQSRVEEYKAKYGGDQFTQYLASMVGMYASAHEGTEAEAFAYKSYEHLILEKGQRFKVEPLPDWIERGPMKACFFNSMEVALESGFYYCEGYAFAGLITTNHAWVVDPIAGVAYDPTWRWEDRDCDPIYMGICFDVEEVWETWDENECYGFFGTNDVRNRYALLRGDMSHMLSVEVTV